MRIKGVGGFSHALPIIDKHVYFRAGEPCKHLNTEESEKHIRWYVAQDKIGSVYADSAKGVKRAVENLGISFEASEPGGLSSNNFAENNVGDYQRGCATTAHHCGLPSCFWSFAGPTHFVHSNNVKKNGKIPYVERYGRK